MTEHALRHISNRPGGAILFIPGMFMGVAILLLWSWNTMAVDLFKMPTAQFEHALALEFFLLAGFLIHQMSGKLLGFNQAHRIGRASRGTD